MLPVRTDEPPGLARLCPGARRSFFCRMKRKPPTTVKVETTELAANSNVAGGSDSGQPPSSASSTAGPASSHAASASTPATQSSHSGRLSSPASGTSDRKYSVIQCTGYLKSWAPAKLSSSGDEPDLDADGDMSNMSCLVAIGRIPLDIYNDIGQSTLTQQKAAAVKVLPIQFMSRHAIDGKFLFVDQRYVEGMPTISFNRKLNVIVCISATLILGFLPQELQGTSMYEYYHQEDVTALAETHKAVLQPPHRLTTADYHFRTKERGYVRLQSEWKAFINPWTKDFEYLVAKNSLIL